MYLINSNIEMENKRRHKRIQLNCMLDVFDTESKKVIGQVLDITVEGFQLMSQEPITQGSHFVIKMQLPEIIAGQASLELLVKKTWGMEDMNIFYTGFHIEKTSLSQAEIIRTTIKKYGNE